MKIDDDETINIHDLDDCQTHTMKVEIDIKEGESMCIYTVVFVFERLFGLIWSGIRLVQTVLKNEEPATES